jgi:hypothetical protein
MLGNSPTAQGRLLPHHGAQTTQFRLPSQCICVPLAVPGLMVCNDKYWLK